MTTLRPFIQQLEDRSTASVLGNAGGPQAAAALRPMLADPDWRVRSKAVQALGKISSAPVLKTALNDSVEQVRFQAAAVSIFSKNV